MKACPHCESEAIELVDDWDERGRSYTAVCLDCGHEEDMSADAVAAARRQFEEDAAIDDDFWG